jgi:hypothetical protein
MNVALCLARARQPNAVCREHVSRRAQLTPKNYPMLSRDGEAQRVICGN